MNIIYLLIPPLLFLLGGCAVGYVIARLVFRHQRKALIKKVNSLHQQGLPATTSDIALALGWEDKKANTVIRELIDKGVAFDKSKDGRNIVKFPKAA